jgi:iron complex transport system ATP-binding protein
VIVCQGLRAGYGRREVLSGIDLTVSRGEMVGLLGPNGAGKTTLLLALTGAIAPMAGRVCLAGCDLAQLPARRRARLAAAVPQRADAALDLTVGGLVLMGRYPYLSLLGGYGPEDEAAAASALAETGLTHLADRPCRELSGGEFQRALIARALAQAADVLVLDEASANLDMARKVEVHDLLAARNASGVTVVAALHDINLAALYCRRLVFLKDGHVVADGPVATVFTQQTLSRIYETDIVVLPHPRTGTPQALVVPGGDHPAWRPADPGR